METTGRRLTKKERAIWRLAEKLNWVQQRLDPDPDSDGDWVTYSEREKEFFYECVESLLVERDIVFTALGERAD